MTKSQNSLSEETPIEEPILVDHREKFEEQRGKMKMCVGYTFTQEAWDAVRSKFKDPDYPISKWGIDGVPVFICTKQTEPMIGWYYKPVMMAFIMADGDMDIKEIQDGPEVRPDKGPGFSNEDEGQDHGKVPDGVDSSR